MKIQIVMPGIFILFFAKIVFANNVDAEEAKKLIKQDIQSRGGRSALMNMRSISRYGHITFYEHGKLKNNFCYHTDIIYPIKLREQIKRDGKEIIYDRGTDEASFWIWTGSKYEFSSDKKLNDYLRDTAKRANREILSVEKESSHYKMITTPPSWATESTQCIQRKESAYFYCFDRMTGLLAAYGNDNEHRYASDWRRVGNIKIPFRLTHYENGYIAYEVQLDHADLNKAIPDAQFVKPQTRQLSCEN